MASAIWGDEEFEFFDTLIGRDDLGYAEIREMMVEAGYKDRGERAYQSKAYRMREEAGVDTTGDPTHYEIQRYLKDNPRSLRQLCDKFDKPPKWVRAQVAEMIDAGYNVIESKTGLILPTRSLPKVRLPDVSITDMIGKEVYNILLIGDNHSGGSQSQPTNMNRVIKYAVEEYGVTKVFHHGDFVCGMYGYRGQENDMAPEARPISRNKAHFATERQVKMADSHIPKIDGIEYFMIGGNHDWWHVVATGMDPLRMLCERRPDIRYMGYDIAKIPLTDKTYMRMWHPTGGVSYAKSYKVQKAIESEGLEALREAIRREESPHVSIITAGHWHINGWVPSAPMYGGAVGCFEGQTNYLKKKALTPDIGGVIMRLIFGDDGRISHIGYDWIPCTEIKDDYKNWPVPEIEELTFDQDDLELIFELED